MPIRQLTFSFALVLIALTTFILPTPLCAQIPDCTNYEDYMHWLVRVPVDPWPICLTLDDDRAYVGVGAAGLKIFDISDPVLPVLLGTVDTPGNCQTGLVIGDLAYIADAYSPGFCVADVSDPASPTLLGQTGGWNSYIYDLALAAPDTFYLADAYFGVRIVEATDPSAPTIVGSFNNYRTVWEVTVDGDLAFIPDDLGLRIFDITETADPQPIGFASSPGFNYALARHGTHMFMASYDSLRVFDVADPEAPELIGSHPTRGATTHIRIVGDIAYLSQSLGSGLGSLELYDVSDPTAPVSLGGFGTTNPVFDAEISNGHAFVTCDDRGILSLDLNDLAVPTALDTLDLDHPRQVTGVGDLAYVTGSTDGLVIIDMSFPGPPNVLGNAETPGGGHDVAVQGDYAYVADYSGGLRVLNVADPTAPIEVGHLLAIGSIEDVAVQGNYAYLCDPDESFVVVDITDPTAPVLVETLSLPGWPSGVIVDGFHAFVACGNQGLQIVDITYPELPTIIGSIPLEGDAADLYLDGDFIYVGGSEEGLHIIDVTDPLSAIYVSTLLTPGSVQDVVAAGGVAYLADLTSGIQIADVSDPEAPYLIGSVDTPARAISGIAFAGGKVCATEWSGGFVSLELDCRAVSAVPNLPPRARFTLTASPNPFNPGTSLLFNLPNPARVNLKVFDLGGRLIRTLISDQPLEAGPGRADWDGRDNQGRICAAGVYLGHLVADGETATGRMVIVK